MKKVYDMKLHARIQLDYLLTVLRVPGGWLYIHSDNSSTFVPWHDSGRQIENGGNYEELKAELKKAELALFKIDAVKYNPDSIRSVLKEYVDNKNT